MPGFEVAPDRLREAARRLAAVIPALRLTEQRLTLSAATVGSVHLAGRLADTWEHWERSQREITGLVGEAAPALAAAADAYEAADAGVAASARG